MVVLLPEERRGLDRVAGGSALRLEGERDRLEGSASLLLLLLDIYVERVGGRERVVGGVVRGV